MNKYVFEVLLPFLTEVLKGEIDMREPNTNSLI